VVHFSTGLDKRAPVLGDDARDNTDRHRPQGVLRNFPWDNDLLVQVLMKLDGTPSSEFEQDDIDATNGVSDAAKQCCAGAVSEAQQVGCESHATHDQLR